jgi:uncharacterized protein (DUF1499 family)
MNGTHADATAATRPSKTATIARYVAIATVVTMLIGLLGASVGLLAPLVGFLLFGAALILGSVLSLLTGLIAVIVTRARAGRPVRPGRRAAWIATAVGAALLAVVAVVAARGRGVPPIHDITTDPVDPPQFVAAAHAAENEGRSLSYPQGRGDVTALQRAAYPDLEPIQVRGRPDQVLRDSERIARDLGWNVVEVDHDGGRLEATATSRVFRFVDDVVVRVRHIEGASLVDLRSTSRVGESDLGANAARIRAFRDRLVH